MRNQLQCKYIFGQTVVYHGEKRKIKSIRFTSNGVLYQLLGINDWIKEIDIEEK